MPVELRNAQRTVRLDLRRLRGAARQMLEAVGRPEATLSVLLTGDREMAQLHERWMGEPGPTDVLSFPMGEVMKRRNGEPGKRRWSRFADSPTPPFSHSNVLGDIAISVEMAARRRPRDVQREVTRLLIHGLLHLIGHDHVRATDRRRMDREARRLWRLLS